MQADIHECVRCGQEFDLTKGGIVYKGREGLVHMCEEHIPDQFNDEALAEDMGVGLRDDDQYEDAFSDVDYDHDDYEDNAQTAEREYHDRKMELYDMWKKEY